MKKILKTNETHLVEMAVQGSVIFPRFYGWEVTHQGEALALPAVGGIVYNVKVGDSVYGWVADHLEPGVSATATVERLKDNPNSGFNAYSCVGNSVKIISGEAKGESGVVVGHHGGVEHVMIDFANSTLEKMTHDDKLLIRCLGLGLKLLDFPQITLFGLSPKLLHSMKLSEKSGALSVPVTAIVPAQLMGSGLGSATSFKGDYDIQTSDPAALKKHGLENLCLGDLVAIQDYQSHWGYSYQQGAMSIGVIVHADSYLAGHGPGVQVLMTCKKEGAIVPTLDPQANIARLLRVGRYRN